MLKTYQINKGKIYEAEDQNAQVLLYINPTEEEKKYLTANMGIDEHTLTSALDPDEIPRVEVEPNHLAIILKRPKRYSSEDKFLFKVSSLGMFLFKEYLIILIQEDIPLFEGKMFQKDLTLNILFLKQIFLSINHFVEHLRVINLISDQLEQKINASMENKYLLNLFILEKSLVYYLNAINSNSIVIEKIKYFAARIGFDTDCLEFLDDLIIENNQCYKQAEIYSNILSSLMDARASIVGNNLNVLMKTLNIITIAIMMPTFVVSIFSMNVKIPLQQNPHAFTIIFFLSVISSLGFLFFWKYKKW